MAGPQLGPVVRARRKQLKRTLADVARASGLSVPFLSQIENGRANPSMRSLQDLADALDTSAVELVTKADSAVQANLVRAGENSLEAGPKGKVRSVVNGHRQLHALEFHGTTEHDDRDFSHPNDELLYVIKGRAEVSAGPETYELEAGDSLYLAAGTQHRWTARTEDTLVLIVGVNDHARVSLSLPADT